MPDNSKRLIHQHKLCLDLSKLTIDPFISADTSENSRKSMEKLTNLFFEQTKGTRVEQKTVALTLPHLHNSAQI